MKLQKIKGYEGLYSITRRGKVFGHKRNKFLKLRKDTCGYVYVTLYKNGIPKNFSVHRLVALAFISNPQNKKFVNHKIPIKSKNDINNLEWVTRSENEKHAYKVGAKKGRLGEENNFTKLTKKQILKIRKEHKNKGCTHQMLADKFNTTRSNITQIINHKTWKHV